MFLMCMSAAHEICTIESLKVEDSKTGEWRAAFVSESGTFRRSVHGQFVDHSLAMSTVLIRFRTRESR